jgi:Ca2+-binding RTX toxin-like protein
MSRRKRTRLAGFSAMAAMGLLALPGVASATVTSNVGAGGVLNVTSDGSDPITIVCTGGNVQVNGADPGGTATACTAITSIGVLGGPGANNINLNGVTTAAFTGLNSVIVNGGDGNDTIAGSEFPDLLNGSTGNDRVIGQRNAGGTRDQMLGGVGDDTLVWNPGDGDDTMDGEAGFDTIEVNGGGGGEEFEVKPSATAGRVQFDRLGPSPTPGPFNLDIGTSEKLDFNGNGGDDTLNKNGGAAGLNPFLIDADGGEGNDIIQTGDAPDVLRGGPGNDRLVSQRSPSGDDDVVAGGDGDDTLVWNPGDGDDTMDGEGGTDTIEVNGGNVDEDFVVKPSADPGRVQFDRVGPTPPGPFNLDIGTSEKLVLNANGGNDTLIGRKGLAGLIKATLNGGDGNDRIKGTDGRDRISGGNGLDVIRSRDRAADRVECDAGFDLALVDKRDTVRGCEIVLGGSLRVKHSAKSVSLTGNRAELKLRCLSSGTCKGKVKLVYKGKSLGSKSFKIKSRKSKTIGVKVGTRGMRLLAKHSTKGLKVKLRIDARDSKGNGWRTTDPLRVKV